MGHNIDGHIIDNLPTLHARAEPTMPPPTTTRSYTSFPTEELQSLLPAGGKKGAASRCTDLTTAMQTLAACIDLWAWRKHDIIRVCNLHSIFSSMLFLYSNTNYTDLPANWLDVILLGYKGQRSRRPNE